MLTTNLLGRKVKINVYDKESPECAIVVVHFDRGELQITYENPDGGLYTMNAASVRLVPIAEKAQ
jgi:hypothetical protein